MLKAEGQLDFAKTLVSPPCPLLGGVQRSAFSLLSPPPPPPAPFWWSREELFPTTPLWWPRQVLFPSKGVLSHEKANTNFHILNLSMSSVMTKVSSIQFNQIQGTIKKHTQTQFLGRKVSIPEKKNLKVRKSRKITY